MKRNYNSFIGPLSNPLLWVGGIITTAGYWIDLTFTDTKIKTIGAVMMAFGMGVIAISGGQL